MLKSNCEILFLLFSFLSIEISAQHKGVVPTYDLFSINQNVIDSPIPKSISTKAIFQKEPRKILVPIYFKGEEVILYLKIQNLLHRNYKIKSSSNKKILFQKELFYQGKIIGQNNSTAFMKISKDEVSMSLIANGQFWSLDQQAFDLKSNKDILKINNSIKKNYKPFTCDSDLYENRISNYSLHKSNSPSEEGQISIYIEVAHDFYLQNGRSIKNVEEYILSVFAQVALIYAKENIDINISEIKVWDTPDPYTYSSPYHALNSFKLGLDGNFKGNLAHLISGNYTNHGGKAFIDVLCDKSRAYGYSNIQNTFNGISDYSWETFIISHEIGHNFGSRHTHDCVWGPDENQAIDDCGRSNETCEFINSNPSSGTIMSYCHLQSSGISFAEGFGIEPGNLIRSKYNACMATSGINCNTAIEIFSNGKFTTAGPTKGFGASQLSADHSNWYKFTAPSDGKIKIFNCMSGIDSRLFIHKGDCNNLVLIANSDDSCGPPEHFAYSSSIPQLNVVSGEQIFIEWDDRWSNDGFDFYFKFGATSM